MPTGLLPSDNQPSSDDRVYDDKFEQDEKNKGQLNTAESSSSLARQEASPWTTSVGKTGSGGSLAKQEQSAKSGAGFAYNPTDSSTSPIRQKFKGMVTKKKSIIGGGIVTGLILSVFGLSSLTGVEIIHGRANILGRGNALANSMMERRNGVSFGRMLRKLNTNAPLTSKLDIEKFKANMAAEGFKAEFDKRKLTSFTDTVTGRSYDFSLSAKKGAAALFAGDEGVDMVKRLGRVIPAETGTWRGFGGAKAYKSIGTKLNNWLDRKPSDKAKNNSEKFNDLIRHADDNTTPVERARILDAPAGKDANGNPTPAQADVSGTGETAAFNKELKSNPSSGDSFIRNIGGTDTGAFNQSTVSTFADQATTTFDSASTVAGNPAASDQIINKALPNLAKELPKKSVGIAARGLNVLGYVSGGCRLRGTLNFIANARNVMVSVELARFAVKYLTAADHTKAHLVNAEQLKLFMLYLHTPNPANGKSYAQAGGWANNVMGDKSAKPSNTNNALYTMNRNHAGLLGSISKFVNGIPGINDASVCKFVNHPGIQVGGMVAGVVVAIFSGGTVTAGQVAGSITLQLLQEAAYQIATPLLIKAGAKMLINGTEHGEMAGDALGSGSGVLRAMNGNGNGMRPLTKSKANVLKKQIGYEQRRDMGRKSLFARYLDPYSGESLFGNMAYAASSNMTFGSYRSLISNNLINPFSSVGGLASKLSNTAYAADPACEDDPAIKKYDLEADIFCNPIVADAPDIDPDENEAILLRNNQIDANGEPIPDSDYDKYIKDCHSGRPSVLYTPNVDKTGNNEPIDAQCIEDGGPVTLYQAPVAPPPTTTSPTSPSAPGTPPPTTPVGPTIPCTGDGKSGKRVQAVYAHLEGQPSNLEGMRSQLTSWASEVNKSIVKGGEQSGGAKYIRFVHSAPPACALDIRTVVLPAGTDRNGPAVSALTKDGNGNNDRKYLVWIDAHSPVDCGVATHTGDDQPGPQNSNNGFSVALVWKGCTASTEKGQPVAGEIHEFMHSLGAVNKSAPHHVSGHCNDGISTLCRGGDSSYTEVCPQETLDCGFDDYFASKPPFGSYLDRHWNTANSAYLTDNATPGTGAPGGRSCKDGTVIPSRDLVAGTEAGFCAAHGGIAVVTGEEETIAQGNESDSLVYHPLGEQPKPSLWARLTGQKAVAQTAPASGSPGKNLRFAAHLGTQQDIQNNICLINDGGFPDETCASSSSPAPAAPTSSPIGGSVGNLECPASLTETQQIGPTLYYRLPDKPEGGVYTKYSRAEAQFGQKELVCTIFTAAKAYKQAYGARSTVSVGDLNASGHASHNWGVAVDLDAQGEVVAADNQNGGSKYNPQATTDLGKAFINTGLIKNIWYCEPGSKPKPRGAPIKTENLEGSTGSMKAIRDYAASIGKPVNLYCISGHYNHFHIDINIPHGAYWTP